MSSALNRKKLVADLSVYGHQLQFSQLGFSYIRFAAATPVYRAWLESQESRAWVGAPGSVVAPECPEAPGYRSPVGTPESAARAGFDLTLNQESCDVEFPFANPPWEVWGLEAGKVT